MKWKEIIFIVLLVGCLLVPAAVTSQWWLFAVFAVFFVCFGLIEWLAAVKSGKTVSQHFWEYKKHHPVGAMLVCLCMLVAWLALLAHFLGG